MQARQSIRIPSPLIRLDSVSRLEWVCRQLLTSARGNNYLGFDPYDGLNSSLFARSGLSGFRYARIAWTQFNKHFPANIRSWVGTKPHVNPKGLALFLSGAVDLSHRRPDLLSDCADLTARIESTISEGYSGACWGYPFPWQGRSFFLPRHTPTVVATAYVASALLDYYKMSKQERWLNLARSACDFILEDLNLQDEGEGICFSYSPIDNTRVHNASLLGAALLARVGSISEEQLLIDRAVEAARFTVGHQTADGAWLYGKDVNQRWVDHFHTGFVLDCLDGIAHASPEAFIIESVERGYAFYLRKMFTSEGRPKYYAGQTNPLDAHCYAQAILTLARKSDARLACRVARFAVADLWRPQGYFGYQHRRYYRNRVSYLRWSQAWMFMAFARLSREVGDVDGSLGGAR